MENNEDFLPIENIIKRDKFIKEHELYQIQAEKNDNNCSFVYIGKYSNIPVVPIFDKKINDYDCSLMSFFITKDDIEVNMDEKSNYNLIGFLISKNHNIGASLMLSFVPDEKIQMNNLNKIRGKFEINLLTKLFGKTIKETIKTYIEYIGKEESIYILTELLLDVIKEK